jgi:hypothetical protein
MGDKTHVGGTRPPLHSNIESDRPVPRRTWWHARYGDPPAPAEPGTPQDMTFSEEDDAARTGDERPRKH